MDSSYGAGLLQTSALYDVKVEAARNYMKVQRHGGFRSNSPLPELVLQRHRGRRGGQCNCVDVTEGPVGPGRPLQQLLGYKGEVVGTIICGDNHINESKDVALEAIRQALVDLKPDLVIAGPAFDAGRYGLINGRQHVPGGSSCGYWHARSGVWNLTTLSVLITMSS